MCSESIDDDFAASFGEIDFDAEAEAFFGDKNSGIMGAFLQNAESLEIFVFMETLTFVEAFGSECVVDFAGRTKCGS